MPTNDSTRTETDRSNSAAVLDGLAKEINEHETARRACEVKGVMHAIRVGELLLEAKKVMPHGQFIPWVKANTKVTQRMAQMYMSVAESPRIRDMIEYEYETVSHLTVRKAVELAGKHKRQEKAVERLKVSWAAAQKDRREIAAHLGECREQYFKGKDELFTAWLIESAQVGGTTAERAPELLDREYDDQAWLDAMLADIYAAAAKEEIDPSEIPAFMKRDKTGGQPTKIL